MAGLVFSSSCLAYYFLSSPGRRAGCEATERRDPVIHKDYRRALNFIMDARVKPRHDESKRVLACF
jgi:hypothetical protein